MPSFKFQFSVLLISIGVLMSNQLMSQTNDAGLWTTLKIETKLAKKLNAGITQEFRFYENITELGAMYTEAGLEYKISKRFQTEVSYRFTQRRQIEDYYSYRHRVSFDLKYNTKVKPIEIKVRTRLLDQYADIGHSDKGGVATYYLRNKLTLQWDSKKAWSPYVSVELFSPLNYPRYHAFDAIRSSAGLEYTVSKHQKLDIYYLIHKEINVSDPNTLFVAGLGYTYKL